MTVELRATTTAPFEEWEDWIGETGEDQTVIVTFETMEHHLYEVWSQQAVNYDGAAEIEETEDGTFVLNSDRDRRINHERFDAKDVDAPGAYKDDSEGCYTVIVPFDFMTLELCRQMIEELNEEFDTDFELVDPEKETYPETTEEPNKPNTKGENQH